MEATIMYKKEIYELIVKTKKDNKTYLIKPGYCNDNKALYLKNGKLAYTNDVFNTAFCFDRYATNRSAVKDDEYVVVCLNELPNAKVFNV